MDSSKQIPMNQGGWTDHCITNKGIFTGFLGDSCGLIIGYTMVYRYTCLLHIMQMIMDPSPGCSWTSRQPGDTLPKKLMVALVAALGIPQGPIHSPALRIGGVTKLCPARLMVAQWCRNVFVVTFSTNSNRLHVLIENILGGSWNRVTPSHHPF